MSADFLGGVVCGFLVGMVYGACMVVYRIIWVEKWTPPKSGEEA